LHGGVDAAVVDALAAGQNQCQIFKRMIKKMLDPGKPCHATAPGMPVLSADPRVLQAVFIEQTAPGLQVNK